jgi:heterotetrameric sarcosine oxidase delta subunit
MLIVPCPHCGPRAEDEFQFGGEHVGRPPDPAALTDQEWLDFVFGLDNPAGQSTERWGDVRGCRRWFLLDRNRNTLDLSSRPLPQGSDG